MASPSKSALYPPVTSGWMRMALPSTTLGWKAMMPNLWSTGSRFSSTGRSSSTRSRVRRASSVSFSTSFWPSSGVNPCSVRSFRTMKGL